MRECGVGEPTSRLICKFTIITPKISCFDMSTLLMGNFVGWGFV